MKFGKSLKITGFALLTLFVGTLYSQDFSEERVINSEKVLPLRDQLRTMQECLKWRLNNIIPEIMRAENIDMWLILSSGSYNRDPVILSLYGTYGLAFQVGGAIVFHDRGIELV